MAWATSVLMISGCWILLLLTLIIYWLQSGRWLVSLVALVLLALELDSITQDPDLLTPAASFVIAAEWYSQASSFTTQCMDEISRASRAITSAFTTGMSVSPNYYLWRVKFLMTKCSRLQRSYVTARAPLSTKTLSARYSGL